MLRERKLVRGVTFLVGCAVALVVVAQPVVTDPQGAPADATSLGISGTPTEPLTAQPPSPSVPPSPEPPPAPRKVPHNLVNVSMIFPPLLQEVRYATTYNFTGRVLYPFPTVFVHRDVAEALQKVQEELATRGLGLKIFDGYRPISVQRAMWEAVPDPRYVSDPDRSRGKHTRGTAVDVTLVDRSGNELEMPTAYDDFTEKAHRFSKNWTRRQRANNQLLESVMKKYGFIPFPFEWWHYDYRGWEHYPPLDISFVDLAAGIKDAEPQ